MRATAAVLLLLVGTVPAGAQELASFDGYFESVAFSPDGKTLAAAGESEPGIRFWDVATGKEIDVWTLKSARAVRFTPDGKSVFAISDAMSGSGAYLRDTTSKRVEKLEQGLCSSRFDFSPDGKLLATVGTKTLDLWDFAGRTKKFSASVSEGVLDTVRFSRDGTMIVAANRYASAHVWSVASGEIVGEFKVPDCRTVYGAEFCPDGKRILVGCSGNRIVAIELATGKQATFSEEFNTYSECMLQYSPDGKKLAVFAQSGPNLLDAESGGTLLKCKGYVPVRALAFSPDGKILASAGGHQIQLWDAVPPEGAAILRGSSGAVGALACSSDGKRVASGGPDRTIRLWDVAAGKEQLAWNAHDGEVLGLAFSPDGAILASGGRDASAKLWDAATGKMIRELKKHKAEVYCVAFSKDGKLVATGSADQTIQIFDVLTGDRRTRIKIADAPKYYSLAFHPDGNRLLAAGEFTNGDRPRILCYEVGTGRQLSSFHAGSGSVSSLAVSPDGKRIAVGSPTQAVGLYEVETGNEIGQLRGEQWKIHAVAYSPDGNRVAMAGKDGLIELWDPESRMRKVVLKGHEGPAFSVAFSGDGKSVVSGGKDGTVRVWPVK